MKITDLFEAADSAAFKVNTNSSSDDATTVYVNSSSINVRLNHIPTELRLKLSDQDSLVDYYSAVRKFGDAVEGQIDEKIAGKMMFQLSHDIEESNAGLIKEFNDTNAQVMAALTTYFKGATLELKQKIIQKNIKLVDQYAEKAKNDSAP